MNTPRIPWSGRGLKYTEEEIATVVEVMRNADPMTQGPYQAEFERRFCDYTGSPHAFAVSSATAALELSAMLCRIGPNDEVILPAHTFAASAIPFARTGAKLIWADIDSGTRVVTAQTIAPLITPHAGDCRSSSVRTGLRHEPNPGAGAPSRNFSYRGRGTGHWRALSGSPSRFDGRFWLLQLPYSQEHLDTRGGRDADGAQSGDGAYGPRPSPQWHAPIPG